MQRPLSTLQFTALVGGGLTLFCAAIFASGLHIQDRDASPSVTVEDIPMPTDSALDDDDAAAMAEAAGIDTPVDDGGAVLPFEPEAETAAPPAPDLTTPAVPDDAVPENWKAKLLYRPTASAAGRIEAQGYQITISGIEPIEPIETCGEGAEAWPCGTAARTQFRQLLRGRALTCMVPDTAPAEAIQTDCSVGGEDVGQWLVAQGWARPVEEGEMAEMGRQAQNARHGIYGSKPVLPPVAISTTAPLQLPMPPSMPSIIAPEPQRAPAMGEDRGAFPPPPTLPAQ
jgi:endonuclease YncB( thermonuclease family)